MTHDASSRTSTDPIFPFLIEFPSLGSWDRQGPLEAHRQCPAANWDSCSTQPINAPWHWMERARKTASGSMPAAMKPIRARTISASPCPIVFRPALRKPLVFKGEARPWPISPTRFTAAPGSCASAPAGVPPVHRRRPPSPASPHRRRRRVACSPAWWENRGRRPRQRRPRGRGSGES